MLTTADIVPTTLKDIIKVAKKQRVAPFGFSHGYIPTRSNPKEHPYGLPEDWTTCGEDTLETVGMCRAWIRTQPRTETVPEGGASTYSQKDAVQDSFESRPYIAVGALIVAAYLERLKVRRATPQSPNAFISLGAG